MDMWSLLAQSSSSPGGAEIVVILLIGVLGLAAIGVWIWSLIHCISNKRLSDTNRIIGVVLIVLLGLIGSLIYLFLPRESQPVR
jgi:uncharacterized BrkB/YihY/UPF0761 family membrane protein